MNDRPVVEITLTHIYETLILLKDQVALLASNEIHANTWRVDADKQINEMRERMAGMVTRREMYSTVMGFVAVISAATPFIAQLYVGR